MACEPDQVGLVGKLWDCHGAYIDNEVEVAFQDGCAVQLASERVLNDTIVGCLSVLLGEVRWECAAELGCVSGANRPIPAGPAPLAGALAPDGAVLTDGHVP